MSTSVATQVSMFVSAFRLALVPSNLAVKVTTMAPYPISAIAAAKRKVGGIP